MSNLSETGIVLSSFLGAVFTSISQESDWTIYNIMKNTIDKLINFFLLELRWKMNITAQVNECEHNLYK